MNKKIISLIVAIVIIAVAVCAGVILNNNQTKTNNENISNQNSNLKEENTSSNSENNAVINNTVASEEQAQNKENKSKVLVLYFSQSGNTEKVAKTIHDEVGGDLVQLETVKKYTNNYNDLLEIAQNEQRQKDRPELKTKVNIDDYDTIFIGYPIWWADMPMAIYTLFDNYDFTEKTIAPFCTSGGSGISGTPAKIKREEPNATVTDGLAISDSRVGNSKSSITNWLSKIKY